MGFGGHLAGGPRAQRFCAGLGHPRACGTAQRQAAFFFRPDPQQNSGQPRPQCACGSSASASGTSRDFVSRYGNRPCAKHFEQWPRENEPPPRSPLKRNPHRQRGWLEVWKACDFGGGGPKHAAGGSFVLLLEQRGLAFGWGSRPVPVGFGERKMTARADRLALAQHTLEVIQNGFYTSPSGIRVDLADSLERMRQGSQLFSSETLEDLHQKPRVGSCATQIKVTAESTLEAAQRLAQSGPVLALNFASAKNPGGGFLGGSQAQEESLARSSGLYASLLKFPEFYQFHRQQGNLLYSDQMIFSPDVPVFRHDSGTLLERPYVLSVITSPAPNAGAIAQNQPKNVEQIIPTLERRAAKILALALEQNQPRIVLGAWGCGVFANDPRAVAAVFADALAGAFKGCFTEVIFAIYDASPTRAVLSAFRDALE
jgi:uncharacterized protein (TIGR02452 family)